MNKKEIIDIVKRIESGVLPRMNLLVNPSNFENILRLLVCDPGVSKENNPDGTFFFPHFVLKSDSNIPARSSQFRWKFPPDRFVEYEKSDEQWAIPLKYGKYAMDASDFAVYAMPSF